MNTTSSSIYAWISANPVQFTEYCIYSTLGILILAVNLLIIVSILSRKNLRTKYILQVALAGGQFMYGLTITTAGINRLGFMSQGTLGMLVTRLECAQRIYTPGFILGFDIPALMDLVISIDRLCAIAKPMAYFTAPRTKYATIASAAVYIYSLISMSFVFLAAAQDSKADVMNACIANDAEGPVYSSYNYSISLVSDSLACLIYTITIRLISIQSRKLKDNAVAFQRLQRQIKLTNLMALIIFLSFILFILPNVGLLIVAQLNNPTINGVCAPIFVTMTAVHCLTTFVVYSIKNEEMRAAFASTLCCRWNADTTVGLKAITGTLVRRGIRAVAPLSAVQS